VRLDDKSKTVLGITRAKAKMFEYDVPQEFHIAIPIPPARLFSLTIGLLGYTAARINDGFRDNSEVVPGTRIVMGVRSEVAEDDLEEWESYNNEALGNLPFAAFFFDAFRQTRLSTTADHLLLILGAAAYYLCDYPGSSSVLARALGSRGDELSDLSSDTVGSIGDLLIWALNASFVEEPALFQDSYLQECSNVCTALRLYFATGNREGLNEQLITIRESAYATGSAQDLLFVDVACAVIRKRVNNSSWARLPAYTSAQTPWAPILSRGTFLQELWPSQRLLGDMGVYRGDSAVIQMPTSAGKTRAIEIILRSAFLSGRTQLAIIVAPFRALCHEIRHDLARQFKEDEILVNEVSDVFHYDPELDTFTESPEVMIVTPEKLLYILRHNPDIGGRVGLVIYDEGHQFDSGTRGVTYELLLTSLKALIPTTAQTILISAVLSNALDISTWLNGTEGKVIAGTAVNPTYRTIAFASWRDTLGRLEFPADTTAGSDPFFVARLLRQQELRPLPGKTATLTFPKKSGDGSAGNIALFLGLTLASKGNVAVFCGKKDSAALILRNAVEVYQRGIDIPPPANTCDQPELTRLIQQTVLNLGEGSFTAQSARLGIFPHHGSVPHGLRISIEHALKKELIRMVVCTSTLAQGVNLPIRYLIIAGLQQSRTSISTRDFHNLLGRAGRAGMHTEGSVIFADPSIFDENEEYIETQRILANQTHRDVRRTSPARQMPPPRKWTSVQNLLNPALSEKCGSSILSIFSPIKKGFGTEALSYDSEILVAHYLSGNEAEVIWDQTPVVSRIGFEGKNVIPQLAFKLEVIANIESFLISQWEDYDLEEARIAADLLAKQTLAYHLADLDQKPRLCSIFVLLAESIHAADLTSEMRKAIGRSLLSVRELEIVRQWAEDNLAALLERGTDEEMLDAIWPLLEFMIENTVFSKIPQRDSVRLLAHGWIDGDSFGVLFAPLGQARVRLGTEPRARYLTMEHVVELCEQALAFEGMLIIAALREAVILLPGEHDDLVEILGVLQKRVRYGVPTRPEFILFELGFSDRHLSAELATCPGIPAANNRERMIPRLKRSQPVRRILENWPSLFREVLDQL
jgi:hypothetical protein